MQCGRPLKDHYGTRHKSDVCEFAEGERERERERERESGVTEFPTFW